MDYSACLDNYHSYNDLYGLSMVHNQASDAIGHLRDSGYCPVQLHGAHPTQTNCNNGGNQHPPSCLEDQYPCR